MDEGLVLNYLHKGSFNIYIFYILIVQKECNYREGLLTTWLSSKTSYSRARGFPAPTLSTDHHLTGGFAPFLYSKQFILPAHSFSVPILTNHNLTDGFVQTFHI